MITLNRKIDRFRYSFDQSGNHSESIVSPSGFESSSVTLDFIVTRCSIYLITFNDSIWDVMSQSTA